MACMSVAPHLDWDDGVDLLDETPPNTFIAEGHCSVPFSPLKVISLFSHGRFWPETTSLVQYLHLDHIKCYQHRYMVLLSTMFKKRFTLPNVFLSQWKALKSLCPTYVGVCRDKLGRNRQLLDSDNKCTPTIQTHRQSRQTASIETVNGKSLHY